MSFFGFIIVVKGTFHLLLHILLKGNIVIVAATFAGDISPDSPAIKIPTLTVCFILVIACMLGRSR